MQHTQKQQITNQLKAFVDLNKSQNKASVKIGVSSGTISQVLNHNWDLVSDDMWRKISAGVGVKSSEWTIVDTTDLKLIYTALKDAQANSNVFAAIGDAGSGKTVALKRYAQEHDNVVLVHCSEYWNRKYFLSQLLKSLGINSGGYTAAEMMDKVVDILHERHEPVIVLDEADKLKDEVLYFFITLFNQLEDHCGIVLIATPHLQKRIERGVRNNRKGYSEIYSRIARKFIQLKGVSFSDVTQVCLANGIENKQQIKAIWDDSQEDLRRVKRKIHAFKMSTAKVA